MLSTIRVLAHNGPVRVELARWQGRLVVTKRVLGAGSGLAERLAREGLVAAKLQHQNIVPLLGVEGDVLVYAYCPGVSLAELLDSRLPLDRVMQVTRGVLRALVFAHGNGVIHLDVKPGNILIRGRQALLTDFGFAKDLALAAITSEHALLGTPGYMAPEQFRGVRDDPRSDVFGAGAVLYHMLAGEPPFGRNALRFLVGDRNVELDPLPEAASHLSDVVERALQREPAERFQSAAEFRHALGRVHQPAFA